MRPFSIPRLPVGFTAAALMVLAAVVAVGASGCATGATAVAASTHAKASGYGSASAYVELEPHVAFDSAVQYLLGREDLKIVDLTEADSRCTAVAGDRRLTFRVIETTPGRSRMSMMVGGVSDSASNRAWATDLLEQICVHLDVVCEFSPGAS